MSKPETMMIDDVKYIREDAAVNINVESSDLCSALVGKYVICRTRNEGINAGYVEAADETGVILREARRIWYHKPADKSLSWYEGVAQSGLSSDSKVSGVVQMKVIVEDYSLTLCTEKAEKSVKEIVANAQ